ncbi:metal ABC transporter solute-binding protein, Zn/Mn family [Synechococcus sp. CC9616]|uniref:metal ABC transporter solute-binding protein, Zn/Mn family n=1 Tax=Synechococcus sp. CC9616 TaxID=110663 RepID=UPI00048CB294|nr:zinc ABC transporter substrate-binding protein [Synechococcus sp. CC9616]
MASLLSRLSAVSVLLGLFACGSPRSADRATTGGEGLKVVTTFLPITLFTEAVAGECADVKALIPPSLGPHDFQASPSDLAALGQASVLVQNGLGIEEFLDDLVRSAENEELVVIDSSRGVATIKAVGGGHDDHSDDEHSDEHSTDNHHEDDHHDDDHEESVKASDSEGHGHNHGEFDPHIWLDPLRAVQQVENIRDGLIAVDPGCTEGYEKNADVFSTKLKDLNTELASLLKPYEGKTFVAFHDFATYFAERYSLKAEFLVDLPEMNPSPADLQRVGAQVKASGLQALLSEPQAGNRSFNSLAKDLGVNIVEFNPLETGSAESAKLPNTYLDVMRSNVNNLVKAIGN